MTLARSWSVTLVGLDGHVVEVEADIAQGLPRVAITGLPDAALNEARDRVRAAVVNSGYPWPQRRVTLGLYPAALPKRESEFDLALAAGLLAADGAAGRPVHRRADADRAGRCCAASPTWHRPCRSPSPSPSPRGARTCSRSRPPAATTC